MESNLIAKCGINCGTCSAYLREKNRCVGCRNIKNNLPISIERCIIRNCETFKNDQKKYCFECKTFSCKRLKQLDKRYREKYNLSLIKNLETIKEIGIKNFMGLEEVKWKCIKCDGTICVHRGGCVKCRE